MVSLAFVAAVLGGFGRLAGALVGGMLLGLANAVVGRYVSSNYQIVTAFAVLLVLLARAAGNRRSTLGRGVLVTAGRWQLAPAPHTIILCRGLWITCAANRDMSQLLGISPERIGNSAPFGTQ